MDDILSRVENLSISSPSSRHERNFTQENDGVLSGNRSADEKLGLLIKVIQEKIDNQDSCVAWMKGLPQAQTDQEFDNVLQSCCSEFEDFAQRKEENETDLQYSAGETIVKRCIQLYIYILKKEFDACESIVAEATKLIKYCVDEKYVDRDYAKGYNYALNGLQIWSLLESREIQKFGKLELETLILQLNQVDEFSHRNRVGLVSFQYYFVGNICRASYKLQRQLAAKLVDMDPENPEWHGNLYLTYRFERENMAERGTAPYKAEIDAIVRGIAIPSAKKDPRMLISYIVCLADTFRHEWMLTKGREPFHFKFGSQRFTSVQEVMSFLRQESNTILAMDAMSVRSNINIARLFSSTLPYVLRDQNFAKVCIKRALLFHPNSSKANHRMGILYLQTGMMKSAGKYLRKAFDNDNRNVKALQDLINWYLPNFDDNRDVIEEIFERMAENSHLKAATASHGFITFLHGIYYLLCNKDEQGIDKIVDCAKLFHKAHEFFEDFYRDMKRFKWEESSHPSAAIIKTKIVQALTKALHTSSNTERKRILEKMLSAAQYAEQSWNSRGRGRGRGGFRGHGGAGRDGFHSSFGGGTRGGGGGFRGFPNAGFDEWSRFFTGNNSSGFNQKQGYDKSKWRSGGYNNSGHGGGDGKRNNASFESVKILDHYEVLGVSKSATKKEVRTAYYTLAKKFHPDKNQDLPEAERLNRQEIMKKINCAWEALQTKLP